MTPIVLDTMVLASGFTSQAGTSGWLIHRWREGAFALVVSEHILGELERTLREDRYFRVRVAAEQATAILHLLRTEAAVTELTEIVVGVATQPKDDLVLSTVLSAGATHLVTRDRQLLRLDGYRALVIVSPGAMRRFLELGEYDPSG